MCGPARSAVVRTYFNFLDNNIGKGLTLIWLSCILMERTDRGEFEFGFVVIIIGLFNLLMGYEHGIKPLPIRPWGAEDIAAETAYQQRIRR